MFKQVNYIHVQKGTPVLFATVSSWDTELCREMLIKFHVPINGALLHNGETFGFGGQSEDEALTLALNGANIPHIEGQTLSETFKMPLFAVETDYSSLQELSAFDLAKGFLQSCGFDYDSEIFEDSEMPDEKRISIY